MHLFITLAATATVPRVLSGFVGEGLAFSVAPGTTSVSVPFTASGRSATFRPATATV